MFAQQSTTNCQMRAPIHDSPFQSAPNLDCINNISIFQNGANPNRSKSNGSDFAFHAPPKQEKIRTKANAMVRIFAYCAPPSIGSIVRTKRAVRMGKSFAFGAGVLLLGASPPLPQNAVAEKLRIILALLADSKLDFFTKNRKTRQIALAKPPVLMYNTSVAQKQRADVAQSVERILGKDEVASSNLAISSTESFRNEGFFAA